jgi:hypothetical protein
MRKTKNYMSLSYTKVNVCNLYTDLSLCVNIKKIYFGHPYLNELRFGKSFNQNITHNT